MSVVRMRFLIYIRIIACQYQSYMVSESGTVAASYNALLNPPAAFPFETPDVWPKWRRRFEQYRVASGLSKESQERQVSTLLYCLGEEAEDILDSTSISEEHRKDYSQVLSKFDGLLWHSENVIIERAKFNRRCQLPEEPAEQFIASLYNLAANCNYGVLKGEMIRDRIVVGIRDVSLSERLQMDPDLTLEKAKTVVRQREAVRDQQKVLKSDTVDPAPVEAVASSCYRNQKSGRGYKPDGPKKCLRYGKILTHFRNGCPAKDSKCHRCGKIGHFGAVCLMRPINTVVEDSIPLDQGKSTQYSSALDSFFLDTVEDSQNAKYWTAIICVNGVEISFKLDTGAEVTAITEKSVELLGSPQLNQPIRKLSGPNRQPLSVRGSLSANLHHGSHSCTHEVFVVEHLSQNLLGLPAIKDHLFGHSQQSSK